MKINFTKISLCILMLFANISFAQFNTLWVERDNNNIPGTPTMATSGSESSRGLAVGPSNEIYVAGNFRKNSQEAVYVYRYNQDGSIAWEIDISSPQVSIYAAGQFYTGGNSIAVADDGIYVTGWMYKPSGASTDIVYTAATGILSTTENVAKPVGFVAKYNFNGGLIWSQHMRIPDGSPYHSYGYFFISDITSNQYNDVFITGTYLGDVRMTETGGTDRYVTSRCDSCCGSYGGYKTEEPFVVSYAGASGGFRWLTSLDFRNYATGAGITADGDHIYVTGYTGGALSRINSTGSGYSLGSGSCGPVSGVDPGSITYSYGTYSKNGAYISKLAASYGGSLWTKIVKSSPSSTDYSYINGRGLVVKNGAIYFIGNFYRELYANFGGTYKTLNTTTYSQYSEAAFVAKVVDNTSTDFTVDWIQVIGSSNSYVSADVAKTIEVDDAGNLYMLSYAYAGTYSGHTNAYSASFDPPVVNNIASSNGGRDIILSKITSTNGFRQWTKSIGGVGSESGLSVATDKLGNLFIAGGFYGTADFDPTALNYNVFSVNGSDGFLAKYGCWPVEISPARDTFCAGELITMNAITECENCNFSYQWVDVASGVTVSTAVPEYTFLGTAGFNQIRLNVTESNSGCISRDTLDIIINPAVSVVVNPASVTVCYGDSVSFTAAATPAIGANYYWSRFGSTTILSTGAGFSANQAGAYSVLADVGGCQAGFNVNLGNYPIISPRIAPDTAAICGASGALLQVVDCPGCGFAWAPPPASSASSVSSSLVADVPGVYEVDIIDPNGCTQTLIKPVTTKPYLTPPIISKDIYDSTLTTLCNGRPLILSTTPFSVCPTCTYSWADGSSGPFTFAFSPGVYNVTVTDLLSGCVGVSSSINIANSILAVPTIAANPFSVCLPQTAEIDVLNPCVGCSYSWYRNSPVTYVGSGGTHNPIIAGDYYVHVTDSLGCFENSTIETVVLDTATTPIVSTTTTELCGTNFATMTTISCSGCNYQWYFEDTITIVGAVTNQYVTNIPGRYRVEVQYPNSCFRKSTNITLNSIIFTPLIGPPNPYICNGEPVNLTMSGAFLAPPYWNYQWHFNGAPITGATGYIYTATAQGSYSVVVTKQGGCQATSNFVNVQTSSAGANPVIASNSQYLCLGTPDTVQLSVPPCPTCTYDWRNANNSSQVNGSNNIYRAYVSQGYYVRVTDSLSFCYYDSPVYQVKDTTYPIPAISASSAVVCSDNPVVLTTDACPSCSYVWQFDGGTGFDTLAVGPQNTYTSDSSGVYKVSIVRGICASPFSASVPITFNTVNAQLTITPSTTSICNGTTVSLDALPNRILCPDCTYEWYRNGQQLLVADTIDFFDATVGGDYQVIVTNVDGCPDTSIISSFSDISVSVSLQSSALAVCGPSGQVSLTVDSCQGCSYSWFFDGDTTIASGAGLNYIPLSGVTDTFFAVNGSAAKGMYKIRVTRGGCEVFDSVYLPDVPAPVYSFDTSSAPYANICGGTPITFTSACVAACTAPLSYQWYLNGSVIPGAIGASHLAVSGGDYQLIARDGNGCVTPLPLTTVTEVFPPVGFGLNLNPVGVIPLSYGDFNLDPYLTPVALHSVNAYSSVPQPAAIISGDMFSPVNAGSGPHLITYTYTNQNCVFAARDTIVVLSQMAVDVVNLDPIAPPYEACITDTLRFILTNFTFAPNQILFPTSATTFDTITVSTAGLTQFAGVWSGNIQVIVPNGAVTGKVKFRRSPSGENFQAPFFSVVQNPAVAIGLNGVPQPLCSNADTIALSGFPASGIFAAAYSSAPGTTVASLISGSNLVVANVANYDPLTGYQFLKLTYTYIPTYTSGAGACPPVIDSLNVQVNNAELDSIEYTPISQTQVNVPMSTLTRLIWPLENRNYPGSYVGTYVTGNNLQASTFPFLPLAAPPAAVTDPVIYTFSNGICQNSITEPVTVWRRPTILDSIPQWVCQNADSIIIQRTATGLRVRVSGINSTMTDANYVYDANLGITDAVNYAYDEFINSMTLTSSNGGLVALNLTPGAELYALIPSQVVGASTDLTLTFNYERYMSYFTPVATNPTTLYTIATVAKTVNIEAPIAAQINPAILADPIFCQDNNTQQFSGIPNGGDYYLNNNLLAGNLFNPNQQVLIHGAGNHNLKYVFTGNACRDSATTIIAIPAVFSVTITTASGPNYCQRDAPDTISVNTSNPGIINQGAGVFLVNTILSGQIFNPAVAPAQLGPNIVEYIAQDTFGCSSSDTTIFNVNPMPALRMDTFAVAYCLNEPAFAIDLYEDTLHASTWHLQTHGYANASFPNVSVTLTGGGVIPSGANPAAPMYSPLAAGVGRDTVYYTYTNTATGCATTMMRTTLIKPLPALTLTTTGGALLNPSYCERDTVPVFASPAGGTFLSLSTTNPGGSNFNTSLIPPRFGANIPGIAPATATEIIGYSYQDPVTFCRDTIRDTILIRNFTTDPTIVGFPTQVCADDTIYVLTPSFGAGPAVTGTFGAFWAIDSSMVSNPAANTGNFNPYLSGIYDTGRDVIVTYTYTSNACTNTVYDTSLLKPLPQMYFFMPGDTLFNSNSQLFHICFSAPSVSMFSFNSYNGVVSALPQIAGTYTTTSGLGMQFNATLGNWNYVPTQAQPGLDSINFTYTSPLTGCTNTHSEPIVVDTVPELGFAGFDPFKYDTVSLRYVYCANDMQHLVIPSPFGGRTYWNYNLIPSILFELRPDTLVVGGVTTIHRLTYEFISARYQNGGVCLDSTIQFVEVRPTPVLTLAANVPNTYCVADSVERLVLSALPTGGIFEDVTLGVVAGILGDSLFNPMAQMGTRTIIYHYTDTVSGCTDTLSHNIDVYNLPDVSFETGGGCQGDTVNFLPNPSGLSNTFPAIDSISMAVWNYGDGVVDTVTTFVNQVVVPTRAHIYANAGVYFPSLTIINRGACDTTFTKRIVVSPKFVVNDTTPYFQDFQLSPGSWFQENGDPTVAVPTDSLWEWGIALGQRITTIQDNNLVWVTNADGTYNQGDNAWVYSPCFDISTLRRPMVALDIWRDSRDGVDGTILQYFDETTLNWTNLGIRNKGVNWYNPPYVISAPGNQVGAPIGWSGISGGWEDARYRLDVSGGDLRGRDNLRFRVAFASSPNSVIGNLEGFAFDNFFIGNRTRSVLVEHFSNQNFAGIAPIESALYNMVYSTTYGRDVNLVQFQTEYNSFDYLHQQSINESNSRVLFYGINNSNQVRINGQGLVNNTSDLVYWAQEILDMQMLQDAEFKIRLYPVSIQGGNMTITADVTALKDILFDDYALHVVVTEDSIRSLQNHNMMSVVRTMRPDPSGSTLPSTWVAGDMVQNSLTWNFAGVTGVTYNPNNLKVVVFVQSRTTQEVYQVATSRNLNVFNGPVAIEEIPVEQGAELIDLNLYPNPTQSGFTVEFAEDLQAEYEWRVMDVLGRTLQTGKAEPGTRQFRVETENYSPGMYIFSINNETVYVQRKVIIAK